MSISPLPLISRFFDTSIGKKNVEKMEKHNHDHCKAASDDWLVLDDDGMTHHTHILFRYFNFQNSEIYEKKTN